LKQELELLGSLLLRCAREVAVPAGGALAVDRERFASRITDLIESHPNIEIQRREMTDIPDSPCIIASGPLTSDSLAEAIANVTGEERLFFYDAAAPIIDAETLDRSKVFAQSRYDKGDGADYLNCPMNRDEYDLFIDTLLQARRVTAKDFESSELFNACQPVEEIARSGRDALRFGPLKPVGLTDPGTGERPWAVVQLRAENREGSAYNLVGFQTNLTFSEQRRVFSLIPGLGEAEFLRYGVMHRNTYLDAPRLLDPTLSLRSAPGIRFAGQITGTEGYLEAGGTGLLCALNTASELSALPPFLLPRTSALGALVSYATDPETRKYQPMHVNWGIVPPLESRVRNKRDRYAAYARRALTDVRATLQTHPLFSDNQPLLTRTQLSMGGTDA
ncbi:MAG: methylenetetrahydrofolate--tRNA-(uracil(54)-C(5))-methyltransferase (FADH(2)-oxidizing) TrmFO, partial [Coriobacteriia bacterium]|nr:methylenetetrahydrofolate--tRNA-(uracil(54)-C(5))-methyltransferase (FADH(2)-oxidizing) TrmFO [Coriobacteriia bacterium]